MIALIALATAASATADVELGGWKAFYSDGQCAVIKSDVPSNDSIEISAISWDIVFNYFKVVISSPASGPNFKVKREPTYETVEGLTMVPKASFTSQKLRDDRLQVDVTMSDSWAKSVSFAGLGLNTSDGSKRVAADGLVGAQKTLEVCRQQYLKKLGIDPAEVEYSYTRAKPSPKPSVWFDYDDLPKGNGSPAPYRPFVIWRIGVDARASRCQLVTSSGKPDLDAAICSSFMKRVRYDAPAFDQQGNAIASWQGRRIVVNY